MIQDLQQRLGVQLDQLEGRGRRRLSAMAHRAALKTGWTWALPAMVAAPTLFLIWGFWGDVDTRLFLAAGVITPSLVFAGVYGWTMRGHGADRATALALFDQGFALKDRLSTADQFLHQPVRDGFAGAALIEAQPWVEQALSRPLTQPLPPIAIWRRRWPFAAAAVVVSALVLLMQYGRADGAAGSVGAETVAGVSAMEAQAEGSNPPAAVTTAAAGARPDAQTRDGLRRGAGDAPPGADHDPIADIRRGLLKAAASLGAGQGRSGGMNREAQQPPSPSSRSASAAAAEAKAGSTGSGAGASASPQTSSQADPTQTGQETRQAEQGADQNPSDAQDPATPGANPGQRNDAPTGRQDAPSQRSGGSSPGRQHQQQQSGSNKNAQNNQGRRGESSNADPGRGDGRSRNGQRTGADEGLKKGRGFAGLLLAAPMRDQLIGQTSRGRVDSVLQQGTPQASPAGGVVAQDRGVAQGDAGVVPHRGVTAHENRLVRDVFSRGSAPAADGGN